MWINFLWALVPIIWLIISLGIIGMPASRACTIGLIITIADAVLMFKQPIINTLSGALEGIIMGIWPIMYVILAALLYIRLQLIQVVWGRLKNYYHQSQPIKEF